jgi:hypothetical protein
MRTATQEENSQLNVRENRRTKISKPTTKPEAKHRRGQTMKWPKDYKPGVNPGGPDRENSSSTSDII